MLPATDYVWHRLCRRSLDPPGRGRWLTGPAMSSETILYELFILYLLLLMILTIAIIAAAPAGPNPNPNRKAL